MGRSTSRPPVDDEGSVGGYRAEYFDRLYKAEARNGWAGQTWMDRARDRLVAGLVDRFVPGGAIRPSVLEVGCGYGYLLERLGGGFDLHGIDVSDHAVVESRRRLGDVPIERADVQDAIPVPGPFQAVVAVNVLEHLPRPEAAIRNMREVLAPGGVAVVHLPTVDGPLSRKIYSLTYARDPTHVWRPSAEAVRGLFVSLGFALVRDSQWPHAPRRLWNALRWHPAYLGVYRRSDPIDPGGP